ncbi:hypothetical protein CBER1_07774 [Cercospora berteroae]|uniref:ribonuclease H n=1 Tax=Cercospora berteroae TaxID=357750 RepID=A0A2S6C3Q7_9PEZI|nr:hypothetical protein CBER1_07774 [Cercospora berteroae]
MVELGFAPPPPAPLPGLPLRKAAKFDAADHIKSIELLTHLESEHKTIRCHKTAYRFVRRNNDREMLIYLDGSCLGQNTKENVKTGQAGCGWVFKPVSASASVREEAIRLELEGPSGQQYLPTSNRAEIRAAMGALQYREWNGEGWRRVVIASDSEYMVLGITTRIEQWVANDWRLTDGEPVKNRDLWQALLDEVNLLASKGTEVLFWKIGREDNKEADKVAKHGARKPLVAKYTIKLGTLV